MKKTIGCVMYEYSNTLRDRIIKHYLKSGNLEPLYYWDIVNNNTGSVVATLISVKGNPILISILENLARMNDGETIAISVNNKTGEIKDVSCK